MNKKIISTVLIILAVLLITTGIVMLSRNSENDIVNMTNNEENSQLPVNDLANNDQEMVLIDTTLSTNSNQIEVSNSISQKTSGFVDYAPEIVASNDGQKIVLFFHASWCPSCRALANDLNKNNNQIPGDVLILKVDYDKENELKQKYGITSQHTLVQIENDGTQIKKWSGGSRLSNLLAELV